MNKAIHWLENDDYSPYRLSRCNLKYNDPIAVDGQPMRYFFAPYGEGRPGCAWMFSFKRDDEGSAGMHWTPNLPMHDTWTGEDFD
jgi:hypothetical protein